MSNLDQRLQTVGIALRQENVAEGGSAFIHQGQVVRATSRLPVVGVMVAVKEYKAAILEIEGQLDRIRQESELGQRIDNPHLVKTYGLVNDSSPPLLLLEWIDGLTLADWYSAQPKPIPWEALKRAAIGIAEGLNALHLEKVYHRDLKPENVMVRKDGDAVVMDIGVAEITGNNSHTLHTDVATFVGSARTASPQFIMGEAFDPRDDIYSLGATYHLLFTGRNLFDDVERKPVLHIMVVTKGAVIAALQPEVPPPLKVLLEAALHRVRERRPSLQEVIECLDNPQGSPFIGRELERQAAEKRTYSVIQVMDNGASFLADLAGDDIRPGREFTVIRKLPTVNVPSYQRDIAPEKWIAESVLKHVYQNVGHFNVLSKHWDAGSASTTMAALGMIGGGRWVQSEKSQDKVMRGDLVLKNSG
jgi:serine/threonine protein kinase